MSGAIQTALVFTHTAAAFSFPLSQPICCLKVWTAFLHDPEPRNNKEQRNVYVCRLWSRTSFNCELFSGWDLQYGVISQGDDSDVFQTIKTPALQGLYFWIKRPGGLRTYITYLQTPIQRLSWCFHRSSGQEVWRILLHLRNKSSFVEISHLLSALLVQRSVKCLFNFSFDAIFCDPT